MLYASCQVRGGRGEGGFESFCRHCFVALGDLAGQLRCVGLFAMW